VYPVPPHCPYLATVPPLPLVALVVVLLAELVADFVVLVTSVVVGFRVVLVVVIFSVVLAGELWDALPPLEYKGGPGIG